MQSDGRAPRSEELRRNLEIADKLRELGGSINDSQLRQAIASNVPEIVVLGPQSAGKSTMFERLLGIKFPQSSSMCTRVPCVVSSRRGPLQPTTVTLRGPDDYVLAYEATDLPLAIADAQNKAVELAKQPVSAKYRVEIKLQGPSLIDFAAVDLPGFLSPSEESEEIVAGMIQAMGEEFASRKNSLVLHVMNIDQDHGNLLTKLVVSKIDKSKVINVFTMPDKLASDEHGAERLADYLQKTDQPRFIIYGKHIGTPEEEVQYLKQLELFDDQSQLLLGIGALGENNEEELQEAHKVLETKYPELRPDELIQRLGLSLQTTFPENDYQDALRKMFETMRMGIRQSRIRPKQAATLQYRLADLDELECGDAVFQVSEGEEEETAVITERVVEHIDKTQVRFVDGDCAPLRNTCVIDLEASLVEEVLGLFEKRGLTNAQFVHPQEILEFYMASFSDRYTNVLKESCRKLYELAVRYVRALFDDITETEAVFKAKNKLLEEALVACSTLKTEGLWAVSRLEQWCKPPLVFTTNDHYLFGNIRRNQESEHALEEIKDIVQSCYNRGAKVGYQTLEKVLAAAKKVPPTSLTDRAALQESAIEIIRKVEAFWKVKVKLITEAAASDFGIIFYVELRKALVRIGSKAQQYRHLIEDTPVIVAERSKYKERVRVLRLAMKLFERRSL